MESLEFVDCPQIVLDEAGKEWRCGLLAEVVERYEMRSTEGPVACATILCIGRHILSGTLDTLTATTPNIERPEAA